MANIRRHILLMSSWFPTRLDPYAGNFIQRFGTLLTREYQVSVIHTMGDTSIKKTEVVREEIDGVATVIVYHPVAKSNKLLHWWYQRRALNKAFSLIEDVDLLFAHVLLPRGLQFVQAKRYYNCPMLLLEHASYFRSSVREHFTSLQRTIIKRTSLHIKQVMAVSHVLEKDMKPLFPTTKIEIVPEFVQLEHFQLKDHQPVQRKNFLHISTLDPNTKNPRFLFEGFQAAVNQEIEKYGKASIHLTVVSDQDTSEWKAWCKEQQMESYIRFEGPATWTEIAAFIQQSDALILTSVYETFSIVVAEAWLTGIPVISTSVGIATDLPEYLGLNIEHNQLETMVHAIEQFSEGKVVFEPARIREHALQYTDQQVLEKLKFQFERFFRRYD